MHINKNIGGFRGPAVIGAGTAQHEIIYDSTNPTD